MNEIIPFVAMPFPVFGEEWVERNGPQVQAFSSAVGIYQDLQSRQSLPRLLKWQSRQQRDLMEVEHELYETQGDLSLRLCCRDMIQASLELRLDREQMFNVWGTCVRWAVRRIDWHKVDMESGKEPSSSDFTGCSVVAQEFRKALFGSVSQLMREYRLTGAAAACARWIHDWVVDVDDDRLRGLWSEQDDGLRAAIINGIIKTGPLSVDEIQSLREYSTVLATERERLRKMYTDVRERTRRISTHVMHPLDSLYESQKDCGLGSLLCWAFGNSILLDLRSLSDTTAPYALELMPGAQELLVVACSDPLFWYIAVTGLLRQSGATMGYGLKQWVVDLLLATLVQPTKVRRMDVPKGAKKTRMALAKRIAPMLKGYDADDELVAELQELGQTDPGAVLGLICVYLASLAVRDDRTVGYRNYKHRQVVEDLWLSAVGPFAQDIMQWIAVNIEAAEQQFDFLNGRQGREQLEDAIAAELPTAHDEIDDEQEEAEDLQALWYVPNPGAATISAVAVKLPTDRPEVAFANFLREQGAKVLVKPTSVLSALEYFRNMPELIRAQTPYDDVSGRRWHKLKRGAQRIYVRLEPDGRLLFHPYARKEWKPAWVDFAA